MQKRITLAVDNDLHKQIHIHARTREKTVTKLVTEFLESLALETNSNQEASIPAPSIEKLRLDPLAYRVYGHISAATNQGNPYDSVVRIAVKCLMLPKEVEDAVKTLLYHRLIERRLSPEGTPYFATLPTSEWILPVHSSNLVSPKPAPKEDPKPALEKVKQALMDIPLALPLPINETALERTDLLDAARKDLRLSLKAVGLLAILVTKKDIQVDELASEHSDGPKSVRSGINELITFGYVQRHRLTDGYGRVVKWHYTLKPSPLAH